MQNSRSSCFINLHVRIQTSDTTNPLTLREWASLIQHPKNTKACKLEEYRHESFIIESKFQLDKRIKIELKIEYSQVGKHKHVGIET